MEADTIMPNENSQIRTFRSIMSGIRFMQKFMDDSDIFTPDSTSFKIFLIQSFCYLHPDFHYLSFLNKEDVDLEIIKVASILQILPSNTIKSSSKLFENMNKDDIYKFWLKLFTLFKKQNEIISDSIFNINWENKINFLRDMESTLNYLNYEFPIINSKRLGSTDTYKEMDIWKEPIVNNEMIIHEYTCLHYSEAEVTNINVENLLLDLEQIISLYVDITPNNQQSKLEHVDFYIDFINYSKNILHYQNDLKISNSKILEELSSKLLCNYQSSLENLPFIKRCNNLIKTLKSKIKHLN